MNRTLFYLITLTFCFNSCKDYSDLELRLKSDEIDMSDPKVSLALIGKEPINGMIRVKLNKEIIAQDTINSHLDEEFKTINLDFENSQSYLRKVIEDKDELEVEVVFINESEKLKKEMKYSLKPNFPPISNVHRIDGNSFEKILIEFSDLKEKIVSRKSKFLEIQNRPKVSSISSNNDAMLIEIEVDTVYDKVIVGRFPVSNNAIYDDNSLEEIVIGEIQNPTNQLTSDFYKKADNGNYIIQDTISVEYTGNIGIYLINIDKDNDYFIQQVGVLKGDNSKPNFENRTWCSFDGDIDVQGEVCIDTKDFYGYNPYNVPFVGKAYGDISKIYIDEKPVNFKIGEEFFFKKRIYLDGGYNRIPVRIIDKNGNETESFIPVTMKDMNNPNIDIDIDNW